MLCPNCAKQLPDDANYCIQCGQSLRRDPSTPGSDHQRRIAVANALLKYSETELVITPPTGPQFTPDPEANAFLLANHFAFLVAVICDQGIKAERAWEIPHRLYSALGHLDPVRLVANPSAVEAVIKGPPALPRYVENVPRCIVAAADRVLRHYGGNAGAIWGDTPTAAELRQRLQGFLGIGQKKSAMAVEILARDLQIPIRALEGSDIAFDVHVRRVFLRTGLADWDDPVHMVEVARAVHPERPGVIDYPAWAVGRQWCRPEAPNCGGCPLETVCAKLVDKAATVKGA